MKKLISVVLAVVISLSCLSMAFLAQAAVVCDGHTFGYEIKSPATCCDNEIRTYTCTKCGFTMDATVADSTTEHILNATVETKAATCTEKGYTYQKCENENCKYIKVLKSIKELSHKFKGEKFVVAPTCTEGGYTYQKCANENCAEIKKIK